MIKGVFMRIKWFVNDSHACGFVRGEMIARAVNRDHAPHTMDCKTAIWPSDYFQTDVMVFQRASDYIHLQCMYKAQDAGVKVIYELDDDLFQVPLSFGPSGERFSRHPVRETIKRFLKDADAVTVSTPFLGQQMRRHTSKPMYVVGNGVDVDHWQREVPGKEHLTIGWMASGTHKQDAPIIKEALVRVMAQHPEVHITLIGFPDLRDLAGLEPFADRVNIAGWQGSEQLPEYMSYFDIGLAPLVDTPFNKSKSGIKAMQYWANRTPVVCSPLPPYDLVTDRENGLFANSPDEWYSALCSLVEDDTLRKSLGENGLATLLREHEMKVIVKDWLGVFQSLITGGE